MMKRRVLVALATALIVAGTGTAQTADPLAKYSSPVILNIGASIDETAKFPEGDSPENSIYTRWLKDKYNIIIKDTFQAAAADYPRKVSLAIAANDLPDAMVVNDVQLRQMVKAGLLQDMTQVFAQSAPPLLKLAMEKSRGSASRAATFNGKLMAIPSTTVPDDGYTLCWIRKDWMDKLGMKPPKTVDDIEALAKAFIEKNPGNLPKGKTIGIGGPQSGGQLYGDFLINSTNNNFAFDPIFSAYGAYPGYWVKGKDGLATYGSIQPETKAALARLASLYKKGLIDPQMAIRKDATEGIVAGQVGIFFGPWWHGYWPFPDAVKQNPNANWQAYAVPLNASGKWVPHTGNSNTRFVVVRKGYDHPEAVLKILNGLDKETIAKSTIRGENYPLYMPVDFPDGLSTSYEAALAVASGKKKLEDFQTPEYQYYNWLQQDIQAFTAIKKGPANKMDIQYWDTTDKTWPRTYSVMVGAGAIYSSGAPLGAQIPFYATTPTIEARWTSLKKLEDDTFIGIILGGKPLSAFDDFVTRWKAQGGNTIISEVRAELASQN